MSQSWDRNWNIVAKTASYTVTDADKGTWFTNRGDTDAITFTLPVPSAANAGNTYRFSAVAAQSLGVTGTTTNLVTFNNVAATSVKYATSSEIAGGGFEVTSDGTSWLVLILGEETQTVTVA